MKKITVTIKDSHKDYLDHMKEVDPDFNVSENFRRFLDEQLSGDDWYNDYLKKRKDTLFE